MKKIILLIFTVISISKAEVLCVYESSVWDAATVSNVRTVTSYTGNLFSELLNTTYGTIYESAAVSLSELNSALPGGLDYAVYFAADVSGCTHVLPTSSTAGAVANVSRIKRMTILDSLFSNKGSNQAPTLTAEDTKNDSERINKKKDELKIGVATVSNYNVEASSLSSSIPIDVTYGNHQLMYALTPGESTYHTFSYMYNSNKHVFEITDTKSSLVGSSNLDYTYIMKSNPETVSLFKFGMHGEGIVGQDAYPAIFVLEYVYAKKILAGYWTVGTDAIFLDYVTLYNLTSEYKIKYKDIDFLGYVRTNVANSTVDFSTADAPSITSYGIENFEFGFSVKYEFKGLL